MVCAAGRFVFGLALLFVCVFLLSFWRFGRLAWGGGWGCGVGLVFVLSVRLFVDIDLCRFFYSFLCRGLAAASACGSPWTFLFTFLLNTLKGFLKINR